VVVLVLLLVVLLLVVLLLLLVLLLVLLLLLLLLLLLTFTHEAHERHVPARQQHLSSQARYGSAVSRGVGNGAKRGKEGSALNLVLLEDDALRRAVAALMHRGRDRSDEHVSTVAHIIRVHVLAARGDVRAEGAASAPAPARAPVPARAGPVARAAPALTRPCRRPRSLRTSSSQA